MVDIYKEGAGSFTKENLKNKQGLFEVVFWKLH